MAGRNKNIDDFFRSKLDNYEEVPESAVWEDISEKLGRGKNRKLIIFITKIAAGMALVVSLGLGYYLINKKTSRDFAESVETTSDSRYNKTVAAADKTDKQESRKILDSKYTEETDVIQKSDIRKSLEPEKEEIYSRESESEMMLIYEATPEQSISERLIIAESEQENEREIRDLISGLKGRHVNRLDNTYSGELLLAERHYRQPAEKDMEYTDNNEKYYMDDSQDDSRKNVWAVGGQLAPLYSYRNFTSDYLSDYTIDQINSNESGVIAYAMGVNVAVSPGKRLSVQSGVYYSKYGQHTDVMNVTLNSTAVSSWNQRGTESTTGVLFQNSTGTVTQSSGNDQLLYATVHNPLYYEEKDIRNSITTNQDINSNSTATQYFEYLEIPLVIKYKLIDRKIDLNILGGFSTNFLVGNNIYLDEGDGSYKYGETVNISTTNYSSSLGMGIEYPILSHFVLNIEPKFKYYLNPIDKKPSYKVHPYSIGIFTGLSYVF